MFSCGRCHDLESDMEPVIVRWINVTGQGIPDRLELFETREAANKAITENNRFSANWQGVIE